MDTPSFKEKIETITEIINIPVVEKWDECKESNNIYYYLFSLNLIDKNKLNAICNHGDKLIIDHVIKNYFQSLDYYFTPTIYRKGNVADIGSGYGFISLWVLISGAANVYSIGDPIRSGFIKKLYQAALKKGLIPSDKKIIPLSRFVREGDQVLHPDIPMDTIDLCLLNDTLEHITPRIRPFLFKSCYNNLKSGGYLISKAQNTDNPKLLEILKAFWEREEIQQEMPRRRKLIREEIKVIGEQELEALARNTNGMDQKDFYNTVLNFKEKGIVPDKKAYLPPINVENDVMSEGYTNKKEICQLLQEKGFKTFVYPAMLDSRRSRYFQPLARIFPFLFFKLHLFDRTTVFIAIKK